RSGDAATGSGTSARSGRSGARSCPRCSRTSRSSEATERLTIRDHEGLCVMTTFIALLRAINVGGTGKLPMAELSKLCEKAGLSNPKTYIQSGNVVFGSDAPDAEVKQALERALAEKLKKSVGVILRRAE